MGEGQPRLITDVKTSSLRFFSFHWQTSIVCIPAFVPLVTKFNGILFSLKQFSKNNDSFSTHDKHYTYKINFFGGIKDGTSNCPKTAAVCRISKVGDEVNVLAPASKQRLSGESVNYDMYNASHNILTCLISLMHVSADYCKILCNIAIKEQQF